MSSTAKLFRSFWSISIIVLRQFRFIILRNMNIRVCLVLIIFLLNVLLVKSTMSASPSISSISYRKVYGEHGRTRIIKLYIYNLSIFSSKIEKYEVDIPKSVLVFLPIVFAQAGRSGASLHLLEAGYFRFDLRLPRRFPQENWNRLSWSSYEACKLAIAAKGDQPMIPEPDAEIGTTSRRGGLHAMSRRLKGLFKSSKS